MNLEVHAISTVLYDAEGKGTLVHQVLVGGSIGEYPSPDDALKAAAHVHKALVHYDEFLRVNAR